MRAAKRIGSHIFLKEKKMSNNPNNIKVGDNLYFVRNHGENMNCFVTKIGRKYATIKLFSREYKVDMITMRVEEKWI